MVALVVAYWAAQPSGSLQDFKFDFPEPIFAGGREVLLGPVPYAESVMTLVYSKDKPAVLNSNGFNGPTWEESTLGFVRWSVKPDHFGERPCLVYRTEAVYRPAYRFDFKGGTRQAKVEVDVQGVREYWIADDGTILRQYEQRRDSRGVRTANCTYGADSVDVTVEEFGKRRATTLYPSDMANLQAQFRPMLVEGKVKIPEKEYLVYDPFASRFERRVAKVTGAFRGTFLAMNFRGTSLEVEGDPEGKFRAFVSDEGDLVKMELPKDRFLILQAIPPNRFAKSRPGG